MSGHRSDLEAKLARRAKQRDFGPGPYIRGARITSGPAAAGQSLLRREPLPDSHSEPLPESYPFLPAVRQIDRLSLEQPVTLLAGENGTGKSTLIEALAIKAGFAARGGALADDLRRPYEAKASLEERVLSDRLELLYGRFKPRVGFFLRAERFYEVATVVDELRRVDAYAGGTSLHHQSHGESFLALAESRFGADGLYVLDEPEAALSVTSQLSLIAVMNSTTGAGAQFIIATHSPILLSYPGAAVYEVSERGLERVDAKDTDAIRLTQGFLAAPERFLRRLEE